MPSKEKTYLINCTCGSYKWTRRPPRRNMRCRCCHRILGPMEISDEESLRKLKERLTR